MQVLSTVGFQAQCGSSWAFAVAAALESKLLIGTNTNSTAALSPQHIMVSAREGGMAGRAWAWAHCCWGVPICNPYISITLTP